MSRDDYYGYNGGPATERHRAENKINPSYSGGFWSESRPGVLLSRGFLSFLAVLLGSAGLLSSKTGRNHFLPHLFPVQYLKHFSFFAHSNRRWK